MPETAVATAGTGLSLEEQARKHGLSASGRLPSLPEYTRELWASVVDRLEVHEVPGSHSDIRMEPQVTLVADVIRQAMLGRTDPETAQELNVALPTLKSHWRSIYRRVLRVGR